MAGYSLNDMCEVLVRQKPFYFHNGFYYNSKFQLVTVQDMRDRIARYFGRYKPSDLDLFENTVREHNRCVDKNPREIYLNTIQSVEGDSFILDWLNTEYPDIQWEQVIYDIIMHKTEKIYVFHGVAEAGKSQLMDMLKHLFKTLAVPLTVKQLSNRFNLGEVMGKLFVAGDDLGRDSFGDVIGLVKSMATGAKVSLEQKFKRTVECENVANFMFCTNNPLQLDITDEGVLRRFVIFYFDKKMNLPCGFREFREKHIKSDEEIRRLMYQLRKVKFDENIIKKLELETTRKLLLDSPANQCGSDVYSKYAEYCRNNGYKPLNKTNFEKIRNLIGKYSLIPHDEDLAILTEDNLPF